MNTYGVWGLAETINAIVLLLQWVPTALAFILTCTNDESLIYFLVFWVGIMHYVDAIRFVVTSAMKVVSFWADSTTTTYSYSGLEKNYKVSKPHSLQYWDFAMEWMGFMASFSLYMDLHTIIEDMDERKKANAKTVEVNAASNENKDLQF